MAISLKQILIGTGIGGILYGGYKLLTLQKAGEELIIDPNANIFKVELSGITLSLDIKIINPNSTTLNITSPFVKLEYLGQTLGSSNVSKKVEPIKAMDSTQLDTIYFKLSFLNILTSLKSFFKAYYAGDAIALNVSVKTFLQLPVGQKEKIVTQTIMLSQKKQAKK
jgi:hypothetical protein